MRESEVLANTFQSVRNLTKFYFSMFPEEKLHEEVCINGKTLNTAYWLAAHLVWTEHFLVLQGVGNTSMDIPWLKEFEIGSTPEKKDSWPSYSEVMETMDKIHEKAMKVIKELPDEELDKENFLGYTFGGVNSKRVMITHLIRHEPMHVGQLSWLLKLYGVETV
ncbi:MAG: DinB family protein [Ignavibacteriae bacterium]|nr:MAG: DinB family protein [Ignavibacteriota bacterium]